LRSGHDRYPKLAGRGCLRPVAHPRAADRSSRLRGKVPERQYRGDQANDVHIPSPPFYAGMKKVWREVTDDRCSARSGRVGGCQGGIGRALLPVTAPSHFVACALLCHSAACSGFPHSSYMRTIQPATSASVIRGSTPAAYIRSGTCCVRTNPLYPFRSRGSASGYFFCPTKLAPSSLSQAYLCRLSENPLLGIASPLQASRKLTSASGYFWS
jgi:hypothetical protein